MKSKRFEVYYQKENNYPDGEPSLTEWEDFFLKNLKEIYWCERELSESIHEMIAAATDAELMDVLNSHLSDTFEQASRLEEIFLLMREEPRGIRCDGMETLIDEAHSIREEHPVIMDEAILIAAQRIELFEIVSYRALIRLAKKM